MPNSKRIIYLSDAQRQELFTNGTITVDGVTITYDDNDIYVTPQSEPVMDVQVDGTSVVSNGLANIPMASQSSLGVVKQAGTGYSVSIQNDGTLKVVGADTATIKGGSSNSSRPILPNTTHVATFYGLTRAAGVDMASSNNAIGTYTPEAKAAIQSMLGISNLLAPTETTTASKAYSIGEVFTSNGKLYKATTAIAAADAIVVQNEGEEVSGHNAEETKVADYAVRDVQVNGSSIVSNGIANVPIATSSTSGVIKADSIYGIYMANGYLRLNGADHGIIKNGENGNRPITSNMQHESTFYGLAKTAGDTSQFQSNNVVGTYTDSAKALIQHMLGTDTNLASYESDTTSDAAYAVGELFMLNGKLHQATAAIAIGDTLEVGTNCTVANAAGVFMRDVQVNGASVVTDGVANVPWATSNVKGLVSAGNGLYAVSGGGTIRINAATDAQIKDGANSYNPIVSSTQHMSTFYGLAKAAGDTTQSTSSNAVGTYTDNAKASIKSMLGIVDGSTGTVDITGTTPTITAVQNTRYVCGEVSTLSFTPPASGISIVRFTSGTTATVLTLPSTVKFPEWFDATALETDTIYELCITDGIYGAVMSWAL